MGPAGARGTDGVPGPEGTVDCCSEEEDTNDAL